MAAWPFQCVPHLGLIAEVGWDAADLHLYLKENLDRLLFCQIAHIYCHCAIPRLVARDYRAGIGAHSAGNQYRITIRCVIDDDAVQCPAVAAMQLDGVEQCVTLRGQAILIGIDKEKILFL